MAKSHSHKTSVTQNKSQKQNNNKNYELEQQNRALFIEYHGSDEQKSEIARKKIILTNEGLIRTIAKKYENSGVQDCDLIQEGYVGLIKAVDSFDCTRGVKFSTYAYPLIRKEISRFYSKQRRVVTSPYADELYFKIKKAQTALFKKLGYQPSVEEIAEELQMKVEKVAEIMEFVQPIVSLYEQVGDSGESSVGDFIEDKTTTTPFEAAIISFRREKVRNMVNFLDENERDVIKLRYGLVDGESCKLKVIAEFLNLPYQKVRQIEAKAIEKMRTLMCFDSAEDYFLPAV